MNANALRSDSEPGILALSCAASVEAPEMHLQWNAVALVSMAGRPCAGDRRLVPAAELAAQGDIRVCHPPTTDPYNPHESARLRQTQLFPAS